MTVKQRFITGALLAIFILLSAVILPVTPAHAQERIEDKEPIGAKVFIKQFRVEGNTLLNPAIIQAIVSANENRELTFAEIQAVADLITAEYRKAGYILANAFVPAQDIKDGIVLIQVIEGKVGSIIIEGNKHYSTSFIQKHLEKVRRDPSLKEQSLERSLLLLNAYPSLEVRAALQAGKEPATTDIVANVSDKRPISFSIGYDNFGSRITSKHRISAALNIGNIITDGDSIMLRGITGLDRINIDRLSFGRIEYLMPIGYGGTRMGIYHARGLYMAGEELIVLGMEGRAIIYGIHISHPFIKTKERTLTVRAGFEYKDVYEYRLNLLTAEDNIRILQIGVNYDFVDGFNGRNILAVEYRRGIRDLFGGAGKADPGTSRLNADGQFNKFNINAARVQKLPLHSHLLIRGSAQFSADKLFVAEQFTIGGMGTVRGFMPAQHSGDSGYNLTAELTLSPFFFTEAKVSGQRMSDTIKLALFADHGGVYRNEPQPGEAKNNFLTAIGAGLRLYAGRHFFFRIDYAVPEINRKFNTRNSKTYLQATVSF